MKWLRTAVGIAAGLANIWANGASGKQVAVSAGLAAIGAVTHITSKDK